MAAALQFNSGSAVATTVAVAFSSNNAAGNVLVMGANSGSAVVATGVTDSQGNTWVKLASTLFNFSSQAADFWYAANAKAGANTVTVTWAGSATQQAVIAEYPSVVTSSPLDKSASAISANGSGSTAADSGATATTTQAGELIVGFLAGGTASNTITAGANFALVTSETVGGGITLALEDRVVSATGAYHATFTMSLGGDWACFVATFKLGGKPPSLIKTQAVQRAALW